jgi:hypothetical protein
MSGLLISSSLAGLVPIAPGGPLADLEKRLPGPPALSRQFRVGEELALYAEVYDSQSQPHDDVLVTTVVAEDGREVYRREVSVGVNHDKRLNSRDGRGRLVVDGRVPLPRTGHYLLRVEASTRLPPNRTVRHETEFRVVR